MYAALWRILPGPTWIRIIIVLGALAAILYALFFYVFPWVSVYVNPQEVTVE
jgi:hypothetical protein